ncbi:MAG TPA: hypothetical protein VKG79_12905, partial [Bryobacteraceae bacterium]|nr:hypothetical protein [Bryobacteraceae bacterium]
AGLSVGEDLAKYMNGTADLDQIIYTDPQNSQLHLIPLRDGVRESADLLHTWDLGRLIANLRGRYHCVFLDLPPSVAISDIQVVGKIVDTGVFVVKWGKTSRSAAMNAIAAMVKLGIPVGGVVLTQVDLAGYALYGYDQFDEYHKECLEYFMPAEARGTVPGSDSRLWLFANKIMWWRRLHKPDIDLPTVFCGDSENSHGR